MTYCFDLDGTLCHTHGRDYAHAKPYPSRIAVVNQLYDEGHRIVIDSARGTVTGQDWQDLTEQQLLAWGLRWHECYVGQKPFADHYVDDKAISAEGFFQLGEAG